MTGSVVYGPVLSWRLEKSLGVDIICRYERKVCSFDCNYCSLGKTTDKTIERRNFIDIDLIEKELADALVKVDADIITFSGTGEPTLARNLEKAIKVAKKETNLPIAVLTNSSLLFREEVRESLREADVVVASLDVPNEELFQKINSPHPNLSFQKIFDGLKSFRNYFDGKLSLEIMFVRENKNFSKEIAETANSINPDEVQINTPLRKNPATPLTREEIEDVKGDFKGFNYVSVYDAKKSSVEEVVGTEKMDLLKRSDK